MVRESSPYALKIATRWPGYWFDRGKGDRYPADVDEIDSITNQMWSCGLYENLLTILNGARSLAEFARDERGIGPTEVKNITRYHKHDISIAPSMRARKRRIQSMNHVFVASTADANKCRCGYTEIDHTDRATCESCGNTGKCNILHGNILMCQDCEEKEVAIDNARAGMPRMNGRANDILEIAQAIDTTVQVRTDLHNAETVAIIDIKKTIDEDESIPAENKHKVLGKFLDARFHSFKDRVFSLKEEITKLESQQRAIQTYYNELSKKLRQEEKAEIKLKDVTYQPSEPKVIKPRISKPGINKVELKKLCEEYGVPENIVSVVLLQKKDISILDAVRHVKKVMSGA